MSLQKYVDIALKSGAQVAKYISTKNIVTGNWVRLKCQFGCGVYGTRLSCPPHSPVPEDTKKVLEEYSNALLVGYQSKSEKLYRTLRSTIAEIERKMFLDGYYKAFGIGAGPCSLCRKCDVESPCKHPEKVRPAMEACGIDVFQTVRNAGIKLEVVKTHNELCKSFGMVLID